MNFDLVVEGKFVLTDQIFEGQLGISDGIIQNIVKQGLRGETHLNVGNSLVFPGFIDIHTHLREPGWTHKEDFLTGTMAAIHGGVTCLVDMPNLPKPTINIEAIKEKKKLAKEKGLIDIFFNAGVTSENIPLLSDMAEHIVGFKIYTSETTGDLYLPKKNMDKAIEKIIDTRKPLSVHCEDQQINDEKRQEMGARRDPQVHCDVRPPESEMKAVSELIHYTLPINFCHISTPEAVDSINRVRKKNKRVHCEATIHHLFLNRKNMNNSYMKLNPPLRDATRQKKLLDQFSIGIIDFLVTDHAPHTIEEKEKDIWESPSGLPGLDEFGKIVSWLIIDREIDPNIILKSTSFNPAKFLNLENRGKIEIGFRGDLTIIDLKHPGKVKSERIYTKCGWSPYENFEFPGSVRNTIVEGKIMSEYDEVFI